MSLVPTWVQAVDGLFYKGPVLHGPGWFVCFDDDDPPEIIVTKKLLATGKTPKQILTEKGIKFADLEPGSSGGRIHPRDDDRMKFTPSTSFFFVLKGRIPIPEESNAKGETHIGECVYYGFPV
ncbi:hypothetical protein LCGC14_1214740 [marine sediment metagenome]|uniref:Uncharacterized protein n=1 Tax=marine sediment metagenome TaxID=412755 RepID=A0A0F9LD75_9ZZZZ